MDSLLYACSIHSKKKNRSVRLGDQLSFILKVCFICVRASRQLFVVNKVVHLMWIVLCGFHCITLYGTCSLY